MKHLKSYKIFESHYNKEEFIDFLTRELSKYNITPLQSRKLIENYESEIETKIANGETPHSFVNQIIKDLNLDIDRTNLSVRFDTPKPMELKYL